MIEDLAAIAAEQPERVTAAVHEALSTLRFAPDSAP